MAHLKKHILIVLVVSNSIKLETSLTVILPPKDSVLW